MSTTAHDRIEALQANVAQVLLGKPDPIQLTVVALLAGGHVLIEDAPGVGKTSLAKSLARSIDCDFTRLQFTPDMLPSDILGSSIYTPNLGEFEFRKGPIFTNVLLADEINRTTPRTQSALLEAMSEGQVSIEGTTHELNQPFLVIATQNPFEYEGTYALPENQLDRFMLCTDIGYPNRETELQVLAAQSNGRAVESLTSVLTGEELLEARREVQQVRVDDALNGYLLDIVAATRSHDMLDLGVSTRGAITLHQALKSFAFVQGRDYAVPDDIKALAIPVLAHRIIPRGLVRENQRERAAGVIRQILDETPVPT